MLVQLLQIGCVLHTFLRVVTVAVGAGTCTIVVVVAVEGSIGVGGTIVDDESGVERVCYNCRSSCICTLKVFRKTFCRNLIPRMGCARRKTY